MKLRCIEKGIMNLRFTQIKLNYVKTCAVLGYYAASCGNCLPTFRDKLSLPLSRVKKSKKVRKNDNRKVGKQLPLYAS
jgi:hypothetical protein